MSNIASKKAAVKLIKEAVAAGWKRSVNASTLRPGERPYHVQVSLYKSINVGLLHQHGHIIVSFRHSTVRRDGISIRTYNDYEKKGSKGLWHARYEIQNLAQTEANLKKSGLL